MRRGLPATSVSHYASCHSINCFAVLSEDLPQYFGFLNHGCKHAGDDELCATVDAPKALKKPLAFDLSMTVVHMSFERQRFVVWFDV